MSIAVDLGRKASNKTQKSSLACKTLFPIDPVCPFYLCMYIMPFHCPKGISCQGGVEGGKSSKMIGT